MLNREIFNMLDDHSFLVDLLIRVLKRYKEEKERGERLKKDIEILKNKNKLYTTTEIAKELGLKSAKQLNKILYQKGIQFNQNGTWVLYSDYANSGYVSIKQEVLDSGKVVYHRKWTRKGKEFLLKLFNREGNKDV